MTKKALILFVLLINSLCLAAEPQKTYDRENVPTTAKISSFFWSTGGALLTTGAVVWKTAPIHDNMGLNEIMITGIIGVPCFFVTSIAFAYVGKNIGIWSDPFVQYFRRHNSIFKFVTNKVADGWNASTYYAFHSYYLYKHIRRSYFQGTLYEDKTITYAAQQ